MQLLLLGLVTTSIRAVGATWLMARPWSTMIGAFCRSNSRRFLNVRSDRPATQQDDPIRSLERDAGIDACSSSRSAAAKHTLSIPSHSLELRLCLGTLEEPEGHWPIAAEHSASRNPEDQRISDPTCGTGDCDSNGLSISHGLLVRFHW